MKAPFFKEEKTGYSVKLHRSLYDGRFLEELEGDTVKVQKKGPFFILKAGKDDAGALLGVLDQFFLWSRNG